MVVVTALAAGVPQRWPSHARAAPTRPESLETREATAQGWLCDAHAKSNVPCPFGGRRWLRAARTTRGWCMSAYALASKARARAQQVPGCRLPRAARRGAVPLKTARARCARPCPCQP
jgi:hypothetical protein